MSIEYLTGDATEPIKKPAVILHICNNIGAWGSGFVMELSKKWKQPQETYLKTHYLYLGEIQIVEVEPGIKVINMIAQHGTGTHLGVPPIRYMALINCLGKVKTFLERKEDNEAIDIRGYSIHMPRIGTCRAGGDWNVIETIINEILGYHNIFVYDLPKNHPHHQIFSTGKEQ